MLLFISDSHYSNLLDCSICPGTCHNDFCFYDSITKSTTNSFLILQDSFSLNKYSTLNWYACDNDSNILKNKKGYISLPSIISNFIDTSKITKDNQTAQDLLKIKTFSICSSVQGGYISIDELNKEAWLGEIIYSPYIIEKEKYILKINSLSLVNNSDNTKEEVFNNTKDETNQNNRAKVVIDSQSDYSYFDRKQYNEIINSIKAFCNSSNNCVNADKEIHFADTSNNSLDQEYCFDLNDNLSLKMFLVSMPTIQITLDDDVTLSWKPESYLYRRKEEIVCLTIKPMNDFKISSNSNDNSNVEVEEFNVLGKSFMTNYDIVFDFPNRNIGFAKADCKKFNNSEIITNSSIAKSQLLIVDKIIIRESDVDSSSSSSSNSINNNSDTIIHCDTKLYTSQLNNFILITFGLLILFLFISVAFYKLKNGDDFLCIYGIRKKSEEFKTVKISNIPGNKFVAL